MPSSKTPNEPRAAVAQPALSPLGDSAVLVRFDSAGAERTFGSVSAAARVLDAAAIPGAIETVAAFATLAVHYDPDRATFASVSQAIERVLSAMAAEASERPPVREHTLPVWYDGEDLAAVVAATGLTRHEVIVRHSGRPYTVHALGFVPGFGYLGDLDPALQLPRRDRPRTRVPAGSVAIAGAQTAVYPFATPGGWHLIGHTDVPLFDASREPAALLATGDCVRFIPQR